jgi:hypothetical protein
MKAKLVLAMAISLMGSVAFAQESASPKFVVVSQNNPGIFKVVYDNPGAAKAKMNIYGSNGERIFSEPVNVEGFVRSVNFNGMYEGAYTIELIDNTGKYVHTVNYASAPSSSVHVSRLNKESGKYLLSVENEKSTEISVRILDGDNNVVHTQSLAVNGSVGLVYNLASVQGAPTFEVADASGNFRTIKY